MFWLKGKKVNYKLSSVFNSDKHQNYSLSSSKLRENAEKSKFEFR
jgi:hypothetical protein